MNKEELFNLIEHPGLLGKKHLAGLDELVAQFPYSQTLQLLKTKTLSNIESPLFDRQLRYAAAYASNRKVLYYLIHSEEYQPQQKEEQKAIVPVEQPVAEPLSITPVYTPQAEEPAPKKEEVTIQSPLQEEIIDMESLFKTGDTGFNPVQEKEEIQEEEVEIIAANEPEELIELEKLYTEHIVSSYTIEDLLADPEEEAAPETVIQTEVFDSVSEEIPATGDETMEDAAAEAKTPVEEEAEPFILMKEPVISYEEPIPDLQPEERPEAKETPITGNHSFADWLKLKSGKELKEEPGPRKEKRSMFVIKLDTSEEIRPVIEDEIGELIITNVVNDGYLLDQEMDPNGHSNDPKQEKIIDEFIRSEGPKLIKSSKGDAAGFIENKAKKSADDNSLPVTETLAQIYIKQKLFSKAIQAYEKLSLKYPEKKTYFASLIINIKSENQLN